MKRITATVEVQVTVEDINASERELNDLVEDAMILTMDEVLENIGIYDYQEIYPTWLSSNVQIEELEEEE
jgi:hypothetical protein